MQPDPKEPSIRWRVAPALPALKLAGVAIFVALGALLADGDRVRLGLALVASAGLFGWALRDLVAPVRLALDPAGITVISGFAGRRHLGWASIEQISLASRPRLGVRAETVEIDTGDSLHLFGRYDLDAPLDEVAAALRSAWIRATAR